MCTPLGVLCGTRGATYVGSGLSAARTRVVGGVVLDGTPPFKYLLEGTPEGWKWSTGTLPRLRVQLHRWLRWYVLGCSIS